MHLAKLSESDTRLPLQSFVWVGLLMTFGDKHFYNSNCRVDNKQHRNVMSFAEA